MKTVGIDWRSLGEVFAVGIGVTVALVALFSLGVRALSERDSVRTEGGSGTFQQVSAAACFFACACAVLYGLYLIIPQLH